MKKQRIIVAFASIFIVLEVLFGIPKASFAQSKQAASSLSAAKTAITELHQLSQNVKKTNADFSHTSLGPWELNVSCGTDCFIGLCFKNRKFWYRFDFSKSRQSLERILQEVGGNGQELSVRLDRLNRWFKTAPADISTQFEATSAEISRLQAEIEQNSRAVFLKRLKIRKAILKLTEMLEAQSFRLQAEIQPLASLLQEQQQYQNTLTKTNRTINTDIQDELKKMRAFVDKQPCRGNADDQFRNIKQQFTKSTKKMEDTLTTLNRRTQNIDNSVSVVLGSITNLVSKYKLIASQLNKAKDSELNTAIQNLHLNIARQSWQELASYAAQQF